MLSIETVVYCLWKLKRRHRPTFGRPAELAGCPLFGFQSFTGENAVLRPKVHTWSISSTPSLALRLRSMICLFRYNLAELRAERPHSRTFYVQQSEMLSIETVVYRLG